MRLLTLVFLSVLVAGCGEPRSEKGARAERRAARLDAALKHEAQPPKVRVLPIQRGELLVIDVPVADQDGFSRDHQKCFVWRDTELRTSSVTCPSREVYLDK